jgi:hypothetical protein
VEDNDFSVSFVGGKFKQIAKNWVWNEKISWAFNVFTLLNLAIFNSENVKNKECVHTWAKGPRYTSMSNDIDCLEICGASKFYFVFFLQWPIELASTSK